MSEFQESRNQGNPRCGHCLLVAQAENPQKPRIIPKYRRVGSSVRQEPTTKTGSHRLRMWLGRLGVPGHSNRGVQNARVGGQDEAIATRRS